MLYGMLAGQDVKLSTIGRCLEESIPLIKTEERLSRHLNYADLEHEVQQKVAQAASRYVHDETYLIVDPSDIVKPYAKRMEYLATVRDGSTHELRPGYWLCCVAATELDSHRVLPLYLSLYSTDAPDTVSENHQILRGVDTVAAATKQRGIYVMDRGGDREELLLPWLQRGLRWIVRMRGDRHLIVRGQRRAARELARGCAKHHETTVVQGAEGRETTRRLAFGSRKVYLPGWDEPLWLVVVWGFGEEPLMLLTPIPVGKSFKSQWRIVGGYLSRWRIEEAIRFWKQSYHLEDIRVLTYGRLRNLVALLLAACFFAAARLGEDIKLNILACRIKRFSKRLFGIPEFHYYALADGIAYILRSTGRGPRCGPPPRQDVDHQMLLFDTG